MPDHYQYLKQLAALPSDDDRRAGYERWKDHWETGDMLNLDQLNEIARAVLQGRKPNVCTIALLAGDR